MRNFELTTADKHAIPVRHYQRGGSRLLIATHGITSEKTEDGLYPRFIESLPKIFDALLFDFRGHGDSKSKSESVTISGEVLDFMTVLKWAREQPYSSIDHIATSFGASITLLAVKGYGIGYLKRVAFWNPVINYRNTFIEPKVEWAQSFFDQEHTEELVARRFTQISDTDFRISSLMTQELITLQPEMADWPSSTPLLILHGDSDTLVPVDDAKIYAKKNSATIKIFKGVDHGFEGVEKEVFDLTRAWLTDEVS